MGSTSELLYTLEAAIRSGFQPNRTAGCKPPSDDERAVLTPPARCRGVGINTLIQNAVAKRAKSSREMKPLTELFMDQVAGIGRIKLRLMWL